MTSIGHIAVTSLARNNPIASLIWGFISHWILDETCNEYKLKSLNAKHLTLARDYINCLSLVYKILVGSAWRFTRCSRRVVYSYQRNKSLEQRRIIILVS